MVTVDAALTHLTKVGLLQISPSVGSLLGNQYEIFAPEEVAEIASTYTTYTSTPRYTSLTQKLDILDILVSGISSITQAVDSKGTLASPKTYVKTQSTDDDDTHTHALQPLLQEIAKVVCVLQSSIGNTEQEKVAWRKVGTILGAELQKIAERAGDVTLLPALLAEHLKRKLNNPPAKVVPHRSSAPPPPPEPLAAKPPAAKKTEPRPAPDKSKNPARKNAPPGSMHSFAECLRYAEHLQESGQGIHNPGGLAQSLYRSGTADALISHFLEWETKKTEVVGKDQPTAPPTRMSADEIARQIGVVCDLIAQKVVADISEMEEKFGSYLHPADWQVIHAGVLQRLDAETTHAQP